jgi:site-specific recombinase XerD
MENNIENDELTEMQELQESKQIHDTLNQTTQKRTERKPKMKATGAINYLDKEKSERLLNSVENLKHKSAILIMMDCGLRVTECVTLKMENFDFKKKVLYVNSLKKRENDLVREIPISNRLLQTLADYLTERKPTAGTDYLFPGTGGREHLTRKSMNRMCDRIKAKNPAFNNLHPHALRHTFATQMLATGTELHNVKTLLGHTSFNTTLIYNHTPIEILRQNIDDMSNKKSTWYQRLWYKITGVKVVPTLINFHTPENTFIIGREKEILYVIDNLNKNINTILVGKIGIGKSHIIKQIEFRDRKILKIDEMSNLKLTFVNMLLYLLDNDKEAIKNMIYADYDKTKLQQKLQKDSIQSLIDEIIRITTRHEYILMIDNVDGITAKGMKTIEQLKDHFTILTTAREIPINKANFIWNFDKITIEPLPRTQSLELIHKLSYDIDVEDFELYRNHIYDQSSGNPRVIFELCERYRKETIVTDDVIRSVRHIGGLPEIDMSFVIVIILAGVSILRYTSREMGGESLRFIGGMALVLLMLSRYFLSKAKRKFL